MSKAEPLILPPVNKTVEPVICPLDFNNKLLLVEFIWVADKSKPPISPPLSKTLEPVIWPEPPFKFSVPPLDSKLVPILKPPIVPEFAVI